MAADHIKAVRFEDGSELECDLFIMAIGVRPNMALAQEAGLYCEKGIVVNDTLAKLRPQYLCGRRMYPASRRYLWAGCSAV